MFSTPNFHIFKPQAQENNAVVARKPGISNSARKPLGDRAVNESNLLKPESVKPKLLTKRRVSTKKVSPKLNDDLSWNIPNFSFKEVKDNYEDILPKSERLQPIDFISMVYPKTPTFKDDIEIDPMFLELPQETFFKFPDEIDLEKVAIEDPEFPDFDFLSDVTTV